MSAEVNVACWDLNLWESSLLQQAELTANDFSVVRLGFVFALTEVTAKRRR